jgi:hypothetical protein
MRAVKRFDSALRKARSAIGHFTRSRRFACASKTGSASNCVRAGFVFPRSLNYLGNSKANTAEQRVGVVRSELDYSTATNELGVLA